VGTIAYMAPEVVALEDSSKYDGKLADIWSCGVMLYVMLCGRYPFDIHKGCIADPTKVNWKVPDGVELSPECLDLLNHMLVKDPAERLTMDGIMRHPWFRTNLPEKVRHGSLRHGPLLPSEFCNLYLYLCIGVVVGVGV
jgi:serine/threonine-protein kinase SRK2